MTNPELEPDLEQKLYQISDVIASMDIAEMDVYAGEFVKSITQRWDFNSSPELTSRTVAFVTKIVSYSSKELDAETGCVPIVSLKTSDEQDVKLDKIGFAFLSGGPNVTVDQEATDTHLVDRFVFLQPRMKGNVRDVVVHRRVPKEPTGDDTIDYFIKFSDLGKLHPAPEKLLDQGRFIMGALGNMKENGLALATQVTRAPYDRAKLAGQVVMQLGKSKEIE